MKLATVEEALNLAGLSERAGNNTVQLEAALESATSQLANQIYTTFERQERIDYFGRDLKNVGTTSNPEYVVNLTNGFIDSSETVKVYYATTQSLVENGFGIIKVNDANVSKMADVRFEVNYEKGRVTIRAFDILTMYHRAIAVRYFSGFTVKEEVTVDVPDELKQACIQIALRIARLSSAPRTKVNDGPSNTQLGLSGNATYSNLIRTFMRGTFPESTEQKEVTA